MSDRVVALPTVQSKLRLYCLRLSDKILILGNGGVKNTKTYEESKELSGYVLTLQNFDRLIKEGVKDGKIEAARKLKAMKLTTEQIATATDLSADEIDVL